MSINGQSSRSSDCTHPDIVEDFATGTTVCRQCARVLDTPVFGYPDVPLPEEISPDALTMSFVDLCQNGHVPVIYANDMSALFQTVIKNKEVSIHQKDILIAVCFYESLKRQFIPRTIKETAGLTGQSIKSIIALLRTVFPSSVDLKPYQVIARFCGKLGIHRRHAMKIEKSLAKYEQYNSVSPETIAAAVITMYCRDRALEPCISEISSVCGLSDTSIRRQIRRFVVTKENSPCSDSTLGQGLGLNNLDSCV